MMRHSSQSGFTLMEVLISVGILAAMSVSVSEILNGVVLARNRTEEKAGLMHNVNVAMAKMYDDINMSFQADATFQGNETQYATGFVGDGEKLDFTTLTHVHYVKNAQDTDQVQVGYYLARNDEGNSDLMRRETDYLTPKIGDGGFAFVLIPNVRSVEFEYYDSTEKDWQGSWDTDSATSGGRLPAMVKIRFIAYGTYEDESESSRHEHPFELVVPVQLYSAKISF